MTNDQTIITTLAVIAGEITGNCKEPSCGRWIEGYRYLDYKGGDSTLPESYSQSCPTCSPIRELDLKWKYEKCGACYGTGRLVTGSVMGEPMFAQDHSLKCHTCYGKPDPNPDLTLAMHGPIPLIVHWMQVLGIWEEFVTDYLHDEDIVEPRGNAVGDEFLKWIIKGRMKRADIMVDRIKRRDAVVAFLAGRG